MAITITPSPFGSVTVTLDGELAGTLSVNMLATSNSVLNMDLGVPGPQGEQGPTGATGAAGVGVPVGGTAGQVLAKIDGTNYNTEWVDGGAGGDYLPLAGGTLTGNLYFSDDVFGSNVSKTFSANAVDGASHSGFILANGGSVYGASLTINFGNDDEGYEHKAILDQSGLVFKDSISNFTYASIGYSGIHWADGNAEINISSSISGHDVNNFPFGLGAAGVSGTYDGTSWGIGHGGVIFPDSSVQTTAFPPAGGTTAQYIDGTGGLTTFPPLGDRYLTTSTTSLTIGNGAKTLTVGTGLSYSPLQEVTIVYDSANHMHASVTSYNSTTGVMVVDVSKHSGSGTYSAWTINVGGIVGGTYLEIANNLSELTATASTARTNLGLGAVATDAYATTAQAQAGTSTTTVISPSTLLDAKYFGGGLSFGITTWATATSGTGASATAQNSNGRLNAGPTSAVGYAVASAPIVNPSRGLGFAGGYDFSKRVIFGARIARNVTNPDTNSVWRLSIGKSNTTATIGDLTVRGLMLKVAGSGALQLLVHNGTSLSAVTSTFTPSNTSAYDVLIVSDGAGNVILFVNGSSVATSTAGPTASGASSSNGLHFEVENTSTLTNLPQSIAVSNVFVQVNV